MEKIKASKVFAMLNGLSGMYFTIDSDGSRRMHIGSKPIRMDESFSSQFSIFLVKSKIPPSIDWKESLREIDFSEDFTEEKLGLINHIASYLAKELSLRDYNRIKGFFEEMEKPDYVKGFIKSLDLEKEAPTKDSTSIFKIDDTVHVLSYSNVGEFGKSTEGVIRAIYKDGTILVKVDEGIEEVHDEYHVSFTPFSIKEAGFSQVRPVQEPKVGDWGFFYDNDDNLAEFFIYGKLEYPRKAGFGYKLKDGSFWKYFSHQLPEGIPNPFTKC